MTVVREHADDQLQLLVESCIRGSSVLIRRAALVESRNLEQNREVAEAILDMLDVEEDKTCLIEGFRCLAKHGEYNTRIDTLLATAMFDLRHQGAVAVEAIRASVALQDKPLLAVSAITMLLNGLPADRHGSTGSKGEALTVLGEMGGAANMAATIVAQYILNESEDASDRSSAVHVLKLIGATAEQVSVPLARSLATKNAGLLLSLLTVLPEIGVTKDAVPALVDALNWEDPQTGQVRNRYISMFMMGGSSMHETVINMLATLGPDASAAVRTLEELLGRSTEDYTKFSGPIARAKVAGQKWARTLPAEPSRFTSKDAQVAAQAALIAIRG